MKRKILVKKFNTVTGEIEGLVAVDDDPNLYNGNGWLTDSIDISNELEKRIKTIHNKTLKEKIKDKWNYFKWRITHLNKYKFARNFQKKAGIKT